MTDITIPPAALEAGARAVLRAIVYDIEPDVRANGLTDEEQAIIARAAFLAIVENWEGGLTDQSLGPIILPLYAAGNQR